MHSVGGGGSGSKVPHSEEVSTVAASFDSSSERSNRSNVSQGWNEIIVWDELTFGHRIQPYRGYAHCVADIRLVSCLLELVQIVDVDGDTVKLLLRSLKFLRLCDYSIEDICSILAHASAYFLDAFRLCGSHMDASEVGNVLVTLMFIAHCYVQDETCPLHVWHQHLFRKYCPVRTLNAAIIRLLEIRCYVLRLKNEELQCRFDRLLQVAQFRGPPAYVSEANAGTSRGTGAGASNSIGGRGHSGSAAQASGAGSTERGYVVRPTPSPAPSALPAAPSASVSNTSTSSSALFNKVLDHFKSLSDVKQ